MITLANVRKDYSGEVTIGPVDLEIPSGGMTALVGPNGAGKSTLLTMIGRLLGLDDGSIDIAGYDVAGTRSTDLARIVSVLRQENHYITRLTVRQQVGVGRFPHGQNRLAAVDGNVISRYVDFPGLQPLEHRCLDQLSGGQRQHAYSAMVLAQETGHVLLDEPLNNPDMRHAVPMMQHLRRACDGMGRTILIVLHDINFASHYADRICAAKDGRIAEFGAPRDIMDDTVLTQVFETPVTVVDDPRGCLAAFS